MPVFTSGGGQVGSAQINDGAIVNADINANAAIALSKLASVPFSLLLDESFSDTDTQIDTSVFSARRYLKVYILGLGGGGLGEIHLQFNGDTGANYGRGVSINGGATYLETGQTQIDLTTASQTGVDYWCFDILNIANVNKLISGFGYVQNTQQYAVTAHWNNTSNQITSIDYIKPANHGSGARIIIFGAD